MPRESGCGPVVALVFKTSGRSDELRRWVRLPRALDPQLSPPAHCIHFVHPLEAEADSPLTLELAIDLALLLS